MVTNQDFENVLQSGLGLPPDRKIYFNGFLISVTPHDVTIVLQNNNQPVVFLNTSHIIAKTLVEKLQELIKNFENDTDTHVSTLDEIEKNILRKRNASDNRNTKKD
jgi:hypothetical protein